MLGDDHPPFRQAWLAHKVPARRGPGRKSPRRNARPPQKGVTPVHPRAGRPVRPTAPAPVPGCGNPNAVTAAVGCFGDAAGVE